MNPNFLALKYLKIWPYWMHGPPEKAGPFLPSRLDMHYSFCHSPHSAHGTHFITCLDPVNICTCAGVIL